MAVHVQALEHQNERAFQKQKGVSLVNKKDLKIVAKGGRKPRWVVNAGLGFSIPTAASEGTYIDNKCPFTSNVSIRGRVLKGMVIAHKMKNTIVMRRHYLHFIPKYNRFEKRHTNVSVHISPAFEVKPGDIVTVGECRPLSKTVSFNVLHVEPKEIFGHAKKQFCLF